MNKMRKMTMLATVMMAALTVSAQTRFEPGRLTIQPRIGATGSEFTNMPPYMEYDGLKIDSKATGGSMIGVDLEYYFTNRFSLAGGLGYMQAGTGWKNFTYSEMGSSVKVKDLKVETAYFIVPIVANWYVAKGLALKTGVQFGFLTKGEIKGTLQAHAGHTYIESKLSEKCKDEMKKFDFSIPVGLSYEFKFPLVIDARYNIGLTRVNKDTEPGEKNSRNEVLVLTLGYKFKL